MVFESLKNPQVFCNRSGSNERVYLQGADKLILQVWIVVDMFLSDSFLYNSDFMDTALDCRADSKFTCRFF